MWSLTSFSSSPLVSWALTTAPSTATPKTPPSSRLVFTVEAAMTDCSDRQWPRERRDARRRRELPVDEQEPEPGKRAADHHRHLRPDAGGPPPGSEAGHDHRHREGGEDEGDLVPREVRDQLQVERG